MSSFLFSIVKGRTIRKPFMVPGVGLHTGEMIEVHISPLPPGSGILFEKGGVLATVNILTSSTQLVENTTSLFTSEMKLISVEHLLASLYGLGITDCLISIRGGEEIPILDGSSKCWIDHIETTGAIDQYDTRYSLSIKKELKYENGNSRYILRPNDGLEIECSIDFLGTPIAKQEFTYVHSIENFRKQIACARTFLRSALTEKVDYEAMYFRLRGLKGFSVEESPVILYSDDKFLTPLRMKKECVRHKILDLLGDLSLSGFFIKAKIVTDKPSHRGNKGLVNFIRNCIRKGG